MVEKSHTSGLWPSIADPLRSFGSRIAEWIAPASDALAEKDAYRITVELPGVAEGDIDLSAHDGVLTLKGEKKVERTEEGDTWFFSERQYGAFSRSFRLPPDADDSKVSAKLTDGVLTITVPKRRDTGPKSRQVKIEKS